MLGPFGISTLNPDEPKSFSVCSVYTVVAIRCVFFSVSFVGTHARSTGEGRVAYASRGKGVIFNPRAGVLVLVAMPKPLVENSEYRLVVL